MWSTELYTAGRSVNRYKYLRKNLYYLIILELKEKFESPKLHIAIYDFYIFHKQAELINIVWGIMSL